MSRFSTLSELDSLQATLNTSLDVIRSELQAEGLPELSSYGERHPLDEPTVLQTPRYYQARTIAIATLGLLKNLIQPPFSKVTEANFAQYEQAGLEIVTRSGLVECLDAAPDRKKGLHVNELQSILEIDSLKLRTVLRMLATRGWFIETSEGTFTLARPALELLPGSSGRKSTLSPRKPHIAEALVTCMTRSDWKFSRSPRETPFQLANNTDLCIYDYLNEHPEQLEVFATSMEGLNDAMFSGVTGDYPWQDLYGKTIIDCGGGSGSLAVAISQAFPDTKLDFVIQDFPDVLEKAKEYVNEQLPGALQDGRIILEPHNFFTPQKKRTGQDIVYVLRFVLHNWSDDYATQILRHLAESAESNNVKVLIVESISVPGVRQEDCTDSSASIDSLLGVDGVQIPPYIPSNFGENAALMNMISLHVMSILNSPPRSLKEWDALVSRSGLKITKVHPLRSPLSVIEAISAA